MKLATVLGTILLGAAACRPGVAQTATDNSADPGAFRFKLNLEQGQKWKARTYVHTKVAQVHKMLPGQRMGANKPRGVKTEVFVKQLVNTEQEVLETSAEGPTRIRLRYLNIESSFNMTQNGKPMPPMGLNVVRRHIRLLNQSLAGQELVMVLTPQGRPVKIEGLEKVKKALLGNRELGGATGGLSPLMEMETLSSMLGTFNGIPRAPIEKDTGFSYYVATKPGFPLGMEVYGANIYRGRQDGLAVLEDSGTLLLNAKARPGHMPVKMDAQGSVRGKVLVDEKTGLGSNVYSEARMTGTVKVEHSALTTPLSIKMWSVAHSHTVNEFR